MFPQMKFPKDRLCPLGLGFPEDRVGHLFTERLNISKNLIELCLCYIWGCLTPVLFHTPFS